MNKKILSLLTLTCSLALVACTQASSNSNNNNSSDIGNSSTTTSPSKQYPSLQEVMTNVSKLKNYTYTLEDEIFDMTTKMYFTEKAYYVDYINANSSQAIPF